MDRQRKAIVIGATSGIGMEVAKVLASKGWLVGIAGRRQELLQQLQRKHLNIVATECIDVTKADAPERLQTLIGKTGGMEKRQNPRDGVHQLATVETNALGMTRMVGAAFHYFTEHPEQKGQIAVISSIARTKGLGPAPAYSATKRYTSHYLECLTQLSHIRKLTNISIHDIRPGFVRTPLISGSNYPMQLKADKVARQIVNALERGRSIITIDWRYKILVFFWRLIPRWIWIRMLGGIDKKSV